jgi:hypothetical protein
VPTTSQRHQLLHLLKSLVGEIISNGETYYIQLLLAAVIAERDINDSNMKVLSNQMMEKVNAVY